MSVTTPVDTENGRANRTTLIRHQCMIRIPSPPILVDLAGHRGVESRFWSSQTGAWLAVSADYDSDANLVRKE